MQNKRYIIAGIFIALVVIIFGILTFKAINDIRSETDAFNNFVGEWSDSSITDGNTNNSVTMELTNAGVINIAGAEAGTFAIAPGKKQIMIHYNRLNGDKTKTYQYSLDGTNLTLTDNETGETTSYTKK